MAANADRNFGSDRLSRRSFLQASVGGAALGGVGALPFSNLAAAAEGGLVALVHTQAAGDNGPIDSMVAALKKLSAEKKFPIRTIYAQDAATYGTIFKSLADAGAAVLNINNPTRAIRMFRSPRRQLRLRALRSARAFHPGKC